MAILAPPYSRDAWILSTSTASQAVGSVLGVGILSLGYIAKVSGTIANVVALDAARGAALQQLGTLKQNTGNPEEIETVERRIAVLSRQINMSLSRATLLRFILLLVHVSWAFLFLAGFFALLQQWHQAFWIGTLVCVCISMFAVLLFVCTALYETWIMMDVDYIESEYLTSLPTKKKES